MAKVRPTLSGMHPLLKKLLYVLGGVLLILLLLQVLITFFLDDYIGQRLKNEVQQLSDSTYTITFDNLALNVFSGTAHVNNIQIDADTAAFYNTRPPGFLFRGSLGKIDIEGVNVISSMVGDELRISTIRLLEPDIEILKNPDPSTADSSSSFSSVDSTIYAALPDRYRGLEVGEFTVQEGQGRLSHTQDTLSSIRELNLSLFDIRVDSSSVASGRTFITDAISMDVRDFMIELSDSLNTIRFQTLSLSSQKQHVVLDSLQLIPQYGELEFARQHGSTIDRIDLVIPRLRLEGFDYRRFVNSGRIYSRYGQITDASLKDYLNRGIAGGPPSIKKLSFIRFRDELDIPVKMDSLRIDNAFISYSEYVGNTPRAGTITFEHTDAMFRNISNYPDEAKAGITTTLETQTRVMGSGRLDVHFSFPMDTRNGFHRINGKLHQMPLTHFNSMVEHVAFVRIDRGRLDSLTFEMTLNEEESSGTLVMNYQDLNISVLDKQSIEQYGLLENFKTFLANNFIVRENNTPETGIQAGRIDFERDKTKSIFNYWWKSLLSGIKESIKN
ncbi:hypothetical protein [Fodinibius sediminis]|uniref:DUF748 domain-containing protein n=1 Tax=Fodinibius sediminis TaxID=1214077 RepID=A0A521D9A1_9BACT|nr:hypothetical protein [Fodinibius sediminis]SMO68294.1 hypothetical protein SAMN06265218_10927 [Fodinibius sediminis]